MEKEKEKEKEKPVQAKLFAQGVSTDAGTQLIKYLKNMDIYQKVAEDYKVQTSWGAALSLLGWAIIFVLVLGELHDHFTLKTHEHMIVDTSLHKTLQVNVNITFHALTCAEVHFDAMDVAGDNQLNIEHDMLKQRLSPHGKFIGEPGIEIIGEKEEEQEPLPEDYCGPCYGAESGNVATHVRISRQCTFVRAGR